MQRVKKVFPNIEMESVLFGIRCESFSISQYSFLSYWPNLPPVASLLTLTSLLPPFESLEALLMCHPAVDDATVTGFAVKGIGHLPRAYIVIKKGYSATAEEILSYANAR